MTAALETTALATLAELVQAYDHWCLARHAHSRARQQAKGQYARDADLRELMAAGSTAAAAGRRFHVAFAEAKRLCAAIEVNTGRDQSAMDQTAEISA